MFDFIRSIQERDPVKPSFLEVLLAYPGVHAVGIHRVSSWVWGFKLHALARVLAHIGRLLTGVEIHPGAKIGKNLFIDHGMGVVIGATSIVGDNVTLYHGVTLGGKGNGKNGEKRHPTLEDNVMVGASAQILGDIIVGEGALVGASAVVTNDVPAGCTAVGNPARFVNCGDGDAAYGLPSSQVVDPIGETIDGLIKDVAFLKKQLRKSDSKDDDETKTDDYTDLWKGSGI